MVPRPKPPNGLSHPKGEVPLPPKLLSTLLPRELLRGVPLHLCMARLGKHWAHSHAHEYDDFAFSEEVEFLDDFLSHDWLTSRWAKLCALMVVYNSRAACIATVITTFLWSILGKALVMPNAPQNEVFLEYCLFAAPVIFVFFLFLVSWQQIKGCFARPGMVFVDKLCISQHDMQKKEEGIGGLAAFLSASQRMVILWSPRHSALILEVY